MSQLVAPELLLLPEEMINNVLDQKSGPEQTTDMQKCGKRSQVISSHLCRAEKGRE